MLPIALYIKGEKMSIEKTLFALFFCGFPSVRGRAGREFGGASAICIFPLDKRARVVYTIEYKRIFSLNSEKYSSWPKRRPC